MDKDLVLEKREDAKIPNFEIMRLCLRKIKNDNK